MNTKERKKNMRNQMLDNSIFIKKSKLESSLNEWRNISFLEEIKKKKENFLCIWIHFGFDGLRNSGGIIGGDGEDILSQGKMTSTIFEQKEKIAKKIHQNSSFHPYPVFPHPLNFLIKFLVKFFLNFPHPVQ